MNKLIALFLVALSIDGYCQQSESSGILGREWKSLDLPKTIEGKPIESSFPTAFTFTRRDGKVHFSSYYGRPDMISHEDTFDEKGRAASISRSHDWQTESTIAISDDGR